MELAHGAWNDARHQIKFGLPIAFDVTLLS
jgi:hypothetical protein